MSTQELVTSIVVEQEESTDQFLSIIQQKIEDAIEVKRIELASQMFAESKGECPECGKAKGDCECEDEEEDEEDEMEDDDEEEDDEDEKEMKEEVEQIDELDVKGAIKNIKRIATGKDVKSRAKQELDKSFNAVVDTKIRAGKKHWKNYNRLSKLMKEEQIDEVTPPGAKYERMVKHIKKGYSKDGLTKREKAIAYATAWKAKNKEMSEAAMSDAQQMTALGMKGAEKAKTMTALTAYRKHGDINKLSAGHRSLLAGYMEKTGGLAAVNRGTAAQALKKERMQEE